MKNKKFTDFSIVCVSNKQEYGNYNQDMEYMETKKIETGRFAIKIDEKYVRIYDINKSHFCIQDSIQQYNKINATYYFKSKSTVLDLMDERMSASLINRYILDTKSGTLHLIGNNSPFKWQAITFHLNCN